MAKIERIYNIPLRKGFRNVVRYRKAKKAVITLQTFIKRHMKCSLEDIRIGPMLNLKIWEQGMRNPPHHVKVTAIKEDDIVKVELFGHKYPETEKKNDKKEVKEKKEKTVDKPKAEKKTETKEDKKEEVKETKKTETKTVKSSPKKSEPVAEKPVKKVAAKKPTEKKTTKKSTSTKPAKK